MLSCIALVQRRSRRAYIKALGWDVQSAGRQADRSARAELRPGEPAWLLSQSADRQPRIAEIKWGYGSAGAAPPALRARIDKALNGRYAALWRGGRALLPIDGWYFEPDPLSGKAPCLVRRADNAPMFIAAITNFWIAEELPDAGFLIVSGECGDGVAGERDREPLVLAPEDAQLWLDPKLSAAQAQRLALALAQGCDAFRLEPGRPPISDAGFGAHAVQPTRN